MHGIISGAMLRFSGDWKSCYIPFKHPKERQAARAHASRASSRVAKIPENQVLFFLITILFSMALTDSSTSKIYDLSFNHILRSVLFLFLAVER